MILDYILPPLAVQLGLSLHPDDALFGHGTRDCHRGSGNLHQELFIGRWDNKKGNQHYKQVPCPPAIPP